MMASKLATGICLLSVTDKTGIVEFARGLKELGFSLLSTGGTAQLLRDAGIAVREVADYTGSPEILSGRVKTLHPKIHGGILFDRAQEAHVREALAHGIMPISLVVVNLYRFREEVVAKGLSRDAAIEHIDIGGPTMMRAAAKNWQHTTPVTSPADYPAVLAALAAGGLTPALRLELAAKAFARVAQYDQMIADYLGAGGNAEAAAPAESGAPGTTAVPPFAGNTWSLTATKVQDLRYGENPQQRAGLYALPSAGSPAQRTGFGHIDLLGGKELSYNNILDLDAATALVSEFDGAAVVIVKHTNPCGCAVQTDADSADGALLVSLYERALACDPQSAFGGIIALNRPVDAATAAAISGIFTECIAAPEFSPEALELLRKKPALRLLRAPWVRRSALGAGAEGPAPLNIRSVQGALLIQDTDATPVASEVWRVVTHKAPSHVELADLRFAMTVAKHVKSNAIVFARGGATVAVGAGQMSRIDAAHIAVTKAAAAKHPLAGAVMASDAFFPFRDTVDFAAKVGAAAIVQPGGSKKDQDSVDAANEQGLAMVFTGQRHFRH